MESTIEQSQHLVIQIDTDNVPRKTLMVFTLVFFNAVTPDVESLVFHLVSSPQISPKCLTVSSAGMYRIGVNTDLISKSGIDSDTTDLH